MHLTRKISYTKNLSVLIFVLMGMAAFFPYGAGADSAPVIYTNRLSAEGPDSAVFFGTVNPGGLSTVAWFEFGTTASLGSTVASQPLGSGTGYRSYSMRANNLQADTLYYARAVAQNSLGTSYGSIAEFTTGRPNASLPGVVTYSPSLVTSGSAVLNGTANPHGSYTTAWFEWGTSPALGFSTMATFDRIGTGDVSVNYSHVISNLAPRTIYYYRAVAENRAGVVYSSPMVNFTTESASGFGAGGGGGITGGGGGGTGGGGTGGVSTLPTRPNATTLPASFVARNSALLNANINPNGGNTSVWFAWGTTSSLGNATSRQSVGSGYGVLPFSLALTGLSPNATYYFQVVAENQYGTQYGAILNFSTFSGTAAVSVGGPGPGATVTRISPSVSTGARAKITLSPSADVYEPQGGDTVEFSVRYLNEGESLAKDAVLKIVPPKEVEYISANLPVRSQNETAIEFAIGDIGENNQGVVAIRVRVKDDVATGDVLIFQAVMNYRGVSGEENSVSVFLALVARGGGNVLGAFIGAFGGWGFWFLILLMAFLLVFLIFILFARKRQKEEERKEAAMPKGVPGGRI